MAKNEEEIKSLLMRMKEEHERASLKVNIKKKTKQNTKIMSSGPISAWQMEEEKVEVVRFHHLLGLRNHCRW